MKYSVNEINFGCRLTHYLEFEVCIEKWTPSVSRARGRKLTCRTDLNDSLLKPSLANYAKKSTVQYLFSFTKSNCCFYNSRILIEIGKQTL